MPFALLRQYKGYSFNVNSFKLHLPTDTTSELYYCKGAIIFRNIYNYHFIMTYYMQQIFFWASTIIFIPYCLDSCSCFPASSTRTDPGPNSASSTGCFGKASSGVRSSCCCVICGSHYTPRHCCRH